MYHLQSTRNLVVVILFFVSFGFASFTSASVLQSDLNQNGIDDSGETEVVMTINATLPAGEYNFNNLVITNGAVLTLEGDPDSADNFKGVKINAENITVENGATLLADRQGYKDGPGAPATPFGGANYYYGSATHPKDLGSGGGTGNNRGGGALWIISNSINNNGKISANGDRSSSGGSVYVTVKDLIGGGVWQVNGGGHDVSCSQTCASGSGGRIAIYYTTSTFAGVAEAKGGCGSYDGFSQTCVQDGTVGFFDTANNNLLVDSSWKFLTSDSPFELNDIFISDKSVVNMEPGASVLADNISIDGASVWVLSGQETLVANSLALKGLSIITVLPEKILHLEIPNILVEAGSRISANGKGYITGPGSPDVNTSAGASHGGKGGGALAKPIYGSAEAPIDFGSGPGDGSRRGGGSIRIIAENNLQNNGLITASSVADTATGTVNSLERGSGGSIYVTAKTLSGSGIFKADGASTSWPYAGIAGGGGRIAIYYEDSSFSGTATAKAGIYCFSGCNPAAEDGTVLLNASELLCTVNCFSSVLFLPGIMGSRLYNSADNELWVSRDDSNHAELALDASGKSIDSTIHTKNDTERLDDDGDETGIIDDVYSANIYQSFLDDLNKWKEDDKIIKDYAFIPYDWRLSLEDVITNGVVGAGNNLSYANSQDFSQSFILHKLEELQASSRSRKVTIIAHSNGGLVAKALVQKLKDTGNPLYDKIDKIIFVAVPQVGTPEVLVSLLHGSDLGHGFIMDADRSRQLSENMPTVYNLLPSTAYFSTVDPAFAADKLFSFEDTPFFNAQTSQYGVYVSNETELKNYILGTDGRSKPAFSDTIHPNIGNSDLYAEAENIHQVLDDWQPSTDTKIIQVAGWGEETLAGLDYKAYQDNNGIEYLSYKPREVVDGDGTVVVPSALWMSDSNPNVKRWWVDLKDYNTLTNLKRVHRDILEISNLRDFIESEIRNEDYTDPDNILVNNNSTLVSNDTRLHYTLHSPLTLGILDSQGRYTGQDPVTREVKEEIPNVTYRRIGDVQFISVPDDIAYTLKLQGYEQGNFSLDVDKQEGNSVTEFTSFQGIPSSASTLVIMEVVPSFEILEAELKIDQNGDGSFDKIMQAEPSGVAIYDVTPPELTFYYNTSSESFIFSAKDNLDQSLNPSCTSTSCTVEDQSGNITTISFTRQEDEDVHKIKISSVKYNDILTIIPKSVLSVEYEHEGSTITQLIQTFLQNDKKVVAIHYQPSTNRSDIRLFSPDGTTVVSREWVSGVRTMSVMTDKGVVKVVY